MAIQEDTYPKAHTVMPFELALTYIKAGKKVERAGWNGKGMYITLQTPDKKSKMSLPYIYMKTVEGHFVPWVASQTDLLANDWLLVPEEKKRR